MWHEFLVVVVETVVLNASTNRGLTGYYTQELAFKVLCASYIQPAAMKQFMNYVPSI